MVDVNALHPTDRALYDEVTAGVEITNEVHEAALHIALANNGASPDNAIGGVARDGMKAMIKAGTVVTRFYGGEKHYMATTLLNQKLAAGGF